MNRHTGILLAAVGRDCCCLNAWKGVRVFWMFSGFVCCREVGEDDENTSFMGRTISKVTAALHHMTPHAQLGVELAVVGGIACGSLVGLMTAGPISMGGLVGSAGNRGFWAEIDS